MTDQIIEKVLDLYIPTKKQNVIMDATVMTALMACPRYFDERFNHNLVPIEGNTNFLQAGQMVHKILEEFNKAIINGMSRTKAIMIGLEAGQQFYKTPGASNIPEHNIYEGSNKILKNGLKSEAKGKLKSVGYDWIMATMDMYFKRWVNDGWTPIEAEKVRGAVVYEDDEVRVLWKAKLDKMVDTFQDGMMPGDYKTMKMNRHTLPLNNQFMGQCLVAGTRKMFIDKIGFQENLKPEDKFVREIMSYTAEQLAEQTMTIGYYAKYMTNLLAQSYYPPNYTHCDKFNGCMYRKPCEANASDRDRVFKLNFMVGEPWDPSNDDDVD